MNKVLSVLSWNVEHFRKADVRVDEIIDLISDPKWDPDIFALYEVEGKEVYQALMTKMPGYTFHITEGSEVQEILVGVKSSLTSFFTQRTEFKEGDQYLRPGALLTVRQDGEDYTFLFLHTKSGNTPLGLGIRDDMFIRACSLRLTLEKYSGEWNSNYIFLGDLNTMGMAYPYKSSIKGSLEVEKLGEKDTKSVHMVMLTKDEESTWWGGTSSFPPGNMDHVIASDNLKFNLFGTAQVTVQGWPKETTEEAKKAWIAKYSDHGFLYFQIVK